MCDKAEIGHNAILERLRPGSAGVVIQLWPTRNSAYVADKHSGVVRLSRQELISMAIVRIRDGALPCLDEPQMYAGFGQKSTCSLCQTPITSQQTEYEVPQEEGTPLFFHVECYDAWIHACRQPRGADAR